MTQTAVRALRKKRDFDGEPWHKLELYPTQPWATRALVVHVLPDEQTFGTIWEPTAGLGHMSEPLAEFAREAVIATDVYNYPLAGGGDAETIVGVESCDFLDPAVARERAKSVDWVIMNPPFGPAHQFVEPALSVARHGVAILLRIQWLEGIERYAQLFQRTPPSFAAAFTERLSMVEGGLDAATKGATLHAWWVWRRDRNGDWPSARNRVEIPVRLIPPGCAAMLTRPGDEKLAARCVPGFIPPSTIKKAGKAQQAMEFA
ncbi:MAG: SAM-dependent DNA methyltransferase [Rhodoblastus sp.]